MVKQTTLDPVFISGHLGITRNAHEVLSKPDITTALKKHLSCDWGEVCDTDWKLNDEALKSGSRIISAYTGENGIKFWIITEADRSATTILLPEDY